MGDLLWPVIRPGQAGQAGKQAVRTQLAHLSGPASDASTPTATHKTRGRGLTLARFATAGTRLVARKDLDCTCESRAAAWRHCSVCMGCVRSAVCHVCQLGARICTVKSSHCQRIPHHERTCLPLTRQVHERAVGLHSRQNRIARAALKCSDHVRPACCGGRRKEKEQQGACWAGSRRCVQPGGLVRTGGAVLAQLVPPSSGQARTHLLDCCCRLRA